MPSPSDDPVTRQLIDEIPDKRAYEEEVRDLLCQMLRRYFGGDSPSGQHTAELRGEFPETLLVVTGPGLKTRRVRQWDFEIWGDDFDPPAASQAALMMSCGMDD